MQLKIFDDSLSKLVISLILFLTINNILYTQFRIKERIVIRPDSIIENNKNLEINGILAQQKTDATLEIEFSFAGSSDIEGYFIFMIGGKNYNKSSSNGSIKFEIPEVVGYYEFRYGFINTKTGEIASSCYSLKRYFNDFIIDNTSDCSTGGFGRGIIYCDNPAYAFFRKIEVHTDSMSTVIDERHCKASHGFYIEAVWDNNICEGGEIFWNPAEPVTLTVSSENGSFYDERKEELVGTTVVDSLKAINRYCNHIVSKLPYNAQPEIVTITASKAGLSSSKDVVLLPMPKFDIYPKEVRSVEIISMSWIPYCENYSFGEGMGKVKLEIVAPDTNVNFMNPFSSQLLGRSITIDHDRLSFYRILVDFDRSVLDIIPIKIKCEFFGYEQYEYAKFVPSAIEVSINPPNISPGDTADIIVKKWNHGSKSFEEIDQSQKFEIGIIGGCDYGQILDSSGVLSNYFAETCKPLRFVAADSLDLDSVEVSIRVNMPDGGGIAGIARNLPPGINNADTKESSPLEGKISPDNKNSNSDNEELKNTDKNLPEEGRNAEVKSPLEQQLADLPEVLRNQLLQKLKKQKQEKQALRTDEMSCEYIGENYEMDEASVSIEEVCDLALPELDPENVYITFQLNKQNNNYSWFENPNAPERIEKVCEDDPNKPGSSKPIEYTQYRKNENGALTKSWILDPYFEKNNEVVQSDKIVRFRIIDPDTRGSVPIYFDFVSDMCWANLGSWEELKVINNTSDLSNLEIILDLDDAKKAMESFFGHSCYPQQIKKYFIVDVTKVHEDQHKEAYCDHLEEKFPELEKEIKNIKTECRIYDDDFRIQSERLILYKIKEFVIERINSWNKKQGTNQSTERKLIEKKINASAPVIRKIKEYIYALRNLPRFRFEEFEIPEDLTSVCPQDE